MGADLYRKSMAYPEGYFRDSYNSTSVLWQLDLSWWRDVTPILDDESNLQTEGIRTLLGMVEAEEVPSADAIELGAAAVVDEKNALESWERYFVEKRERLIAYLRGALEDNDPIHCSL